MKVTDDSLFTEPDLALQTMRKNRSWGRSLPVLAIRQWLTPTGARGFPSERSRQKTSPSIESP